MKPHLAISSLRESIGLSQASYAEKIGVRRTYLISLEAGRMVPGAKVLRGLFRLHGPEGLEAAGVTWWDLLGMREPRG
jgi:transcriptional regulator with XRE-family HTH domain